MDGWIIFSLQFFIFFPPFCPLSYSPATSSLAALLNNHLSFLLPQHTQHLYQGALHLHHILGLMLGVTYAK